MRNLKTKLLTLLLLLTLGSTFMPLQVTRADDGGTQGSTDSQRKSSTTSSGSSLDLQTLIAILSALSSLGH